MVVSRLGSGNELLDRISGWCAFHPNWTITLVLLASLAPFLGKPFNIDDPLFIWAARHVHAQPLDPYRFDVNWDVRAVPMWKATKNPPLSCYYLAMAAALLGWSEPALHSAFLLPALAVILGTYRLARHFCSRPLLAALATLFTPVFLVSSSTVMCDVLMLAFWVWAIVMWVEGTGRNELWRLLGSGLLITLAELTKYYGACLIPLLAAYSFLRQQRPWQTTCLLIPLAGLAAYEGITRALYGQGLLSGAGTWAGFAKGYLAFSRVDNALIALAFTGGCLAVASLFAPLLWRGQWLAAITVPTILLGVAIFEGAVANKYPFLTASQTAVEIQAVFWAAGGVCVLALATADLLRHRNAGSALLVLWVLGTFVFAAFFNWVVNGRSILPMAPAAGILLARRLEQNSSEGRNPGALAMGVPLVAGAALALLVLRADFLFAATLRRAAQQTCAPSAQGRHTLWFEGHWGFQYYMEALGASALDVLRSTPQPGDTLALPLGNSYVLPPPQTTTVQATLAIPGPRWLATVNPEIGAGFYASVIGPLPFAFGAVPPQNVTLCTFQLAKSF